MPELWRESPARRRRPLITRSLNFDNALPSDFELMIPVELPAISQSTSLSSGSPSVDFTESLWPIAGSAGVGGAVADATEFPTRLVLLDPTGPVSAVAGNSLCSLRIRSS